MPYTSPLTGRSPASSTTPSPALSRSSSYLEDGPTSPAISRPTPPRSLSFAHKHRRSPSIPKVDFDAAPPTPTDAPDATISTNDFAWNTSLRQSPSPVSDAPIPIQLVMSPPESSENSDGDDTTPTDRGRSLGTSALDMQQLHTAVSQIPQRREGSPDNSRETRFAATISEPVTQTTSPTALSAEQRKVSHSRSSTESAIIIPRAATFDTSGPTSDEEDEDESGMRPSLVRKKSGELVKPALRPSSRRRYSSMPGTPTYNKSVHFNDTENQTRHFLQVDKPIAVSAGTSPVEMYESDSEFPFDEPKEERQMKLANFPADNFERRSKPVWVERIFLSADKQTLIGVVTVQNISFHKLVIARFTLDYWKTTSEVVAEYNNDPRNPSKDGCDRFNFHIKLSDQANVDNKTLLLCIRYNVGGQDFWDNNDNTNYQVDFTKTVNKPKKPAMTNGLGARPLNAIPRSRHTPPGSSRGQRDSIDDDFATRFDSGSTYHFGPADQLLGESPSSIKLKPRSKRGSIFPVNDLPPVATNGLGGRYDFGASLSAALSTAQDKLGRGSGLMGPVQEPANGSYFGPIDRTDGPVKVDEKPDALTTDRPAMGSDQYKDLVQKFCYFTSGPGKPTPASPQPMVTQDITQDVTQPTLKPLQPPAKIDGADDNEPSSPTDSSSSDESGSSSPPEEDEESHPSPSVSPFISRTGSPSLLTGGGLGGRASPNHFSYPSISNLRDGYLSDSQTPTAIQG